MSDSTQKRGEDTPHDMTNACVRHKRQNAVENLHSQSPGGLTYSHVWHFYVLRLHSFPQCISVHSTSVSPPPCDECAVITWILGIPKRKLLAERPRREWDWIECRINHFQDFKAFCVQRNNYQSKKRAFDKLNALSLVLIQLNWRKGTKPARVFPALRLHIIKVQRKCHETRGKDSRLQVGNFFATVPFSASVFYFFIQLSVKCSKIPFRFVENGWKKVWNPRCNQEWMLRHSMCMWAYENVARELSFNWLWVSTL